MVSLTWYHDYDTITSEELWIHLLFGSGYISYLDTSYLDTSEYVSYLDTSLMVVRPSRTLTIQCIL